MLLGHLWNNFKIKIIKLNTLDTFVKFILGY